MGGRETDEGGDSWASCLDKIEVLDSVCVCQCMCACDMSGINGYYRYDNVNYSQTIRPEECRLIYLAATQL